MSLTLSLVNIDTLENGETTRLVLDRHGALIGRSPNADWCLPDPKKHISFTHCEIVYRGADYMLVDRSTNGTFLNGAPERLGEPHVLKSGDEFVIGPYRVRAQLGGAGAAAPPPAKDDASGWGWDTPVAPPPQAIAPRAPSGGWDTPAEPAPRAATPPPPTAVWDTPSSGPSPEASPWGDLPSPQPAANWPQEKPGAAISGRGTGTENWAPPRVAAPTADVWSRFAAVNEIDWSGSGVAVSQPAAWSGEATPAEPAPAAEGIAPAPQTAPHSTAPVPSPAGADDAWNALLQAAGIAPQDIKGPGKQTGATAGAMLRRLIGGLVVMLEARARAKSELGATATIIEVHGNNPLKFLRQPETALIRLLNPPERGFMDTDRAVEDAFKDLQAHQMASLAAMQGALRDTLARFAPSAIKTRTAKGGFLAAILPSVRDAALWRAYEREFEGVVKGSDEAFMDFFAKAFREAYQKASLEMRRK